LGLNGLSFLNSRLRILAVSPRFAPTNGADTHRLRLLLNHAAASGWQVEVLAVDSADVVGPVDPWLAGNLPADVPVHRVRAWQLRGWGLNGLAQRSFWPLYRKGAALLATGRFDLVFFSTTEFALHVLGPLWQRRYGVPFCMDYQDPWVNDYYRNHPAVVPPGGRLKFSVADRMHRAMECFVVRYCAGFMAVSPAYLTELELRYGAAVTGKPMLVKPFPAEPAELDALRAGTGSTTAESACKIWRYIGRGGPDMVKAASAFFRAWQQAVYDGQLALDAAFFEASGTSYAAAGSGEKTFEPLVEGTGLASQVRENPDRLGYSDALRALIQSDALVVFGSDDSAYTASKIYPYLLAGKPLLAIFHENSSVVQLMREAGGGVCVTFNAETSIDALAVAIERGWFLPMQYNRVVPLKEAEFWPYTAKAQASEIREWLAACLG
jgi:hypothetical protein